MREKGRCDGFTLLEVMVALSILAVAASGLIGATGQSLKHQAWIEEKTIAGWIAENRITEIRNQREWLPTGRSGDTVTMANRQWDVHVDVSDMARPDMRKLLVEVSPTQAPSPVPVYSLIGFIGKK